MSLTYPCARRDEVTDTLAGVSFPDPYRWLEQDSDEVRQWQRAQAELASRHVREWPHFDRLKQLVARFSVPNPGRSGALPRYAAGRWFRLHFAEGVRQARAIVSETFAGEGRILFDPAIENPELPPYLSWISPSPDGRTLALGVCPDGSENNTIRLVDVETARLLDDPPTQVLMDNWTGGVSWLPDSSGFFFSAISGAAIDFVQQVYLHRRGAVASTAPVDPPWTLEISSSAPRDYRMVVVSADGRYAVAMERRRHPIPVAIAALSDGALCWRPFITAVGEGIVAGHAVGESFIAVTDIGAPRGRLVAIPLDAADPNDPSSWRELLPESDAVMRTVTPIGEVLYLHELVNTYSRVRMAGLDGSLLGVVPLPDRGAVSEHPFWMMNLVPKGHPGQFIFGFSSLTVAPGIYAHTPGEAALETLIAPPLRLENVLVEDRWAVSADGAHVPFHLVRRCDVSPDVPQPTLIYGYGGFNAPNAPQFPGLPFPGAAFVTAGGVFIHAHLRGGGELGREWWDEGRWRNKQNCYYDLYAIAENLIALGRTTPQQLAVTGGSNGGLMAGVAMTQRPDLWAVVVPRVPHLDLIGACREPYSRQAVMSEYCADIEDSEEVRRLASISPYQLIRDGLKYPAIYLDAGATDPRCPPWESRKFAARLQAASSGDAPILLRVWERTGHGWATDKDTALTQNAEWLAFIMRHLRMRDWV